MYYKWKGECLGIWLNKRVLASMHKALDSVPILKRKDYFIQYSYQATEL